jgi:hypothetical protein
MKLKNKNVHIYGWSKRYQEERYFNISLSPLEFYEAYKYDWLNVSIEEELLISNSVEAKEAVASYALIRIEDRLRMLKKKNPLTAEKEDPSNFYLRLIDTTKTFSLI